MRISRFTGSVARSLLTVAVLLGMVPTVLAQEAAVHGRFAYQLSYGYEADTIIDNALAVRLDLERRLGFAGRVRLGFDGRISAAGGASTLHLGEAYADVYLDAVDLRVGRQVIAWGTADGFNPTNVINPQSTPSLAALVTSGGLPEGTPVTAVQASYYLPSGGSLTGVAVAGFVPAAGARAALDAVAAEAGARLGGGPLPVVGPTPLPDAETQFEWAVRGEGLFAGYNVYLSYFRGFDDYPAAWLEFDATPLGPVPARLVAAYRRVHKLGLAAAGTVGGAAVWAEIGYTAPDKMAALDGPGALASNAAYLEAVVGADYTFAGGVTVVGQVIYSGGGSLLSPYHEPGGGLQPQTYLAGIVRYAPRPGQELQGTALVNAGDGGAIVMGRYAYDLAQGVSFTVGASHVLARPGAAFRAAQAAANVVTAGISASF